MAAAWTGVGVVKPEAASFLCKLEDRGSSVNVFNCMLLFLLAETDRFGERGIDRAERAMPSVYTLNKRRGQKAGNLRSVSKP